MEQAHVSRYTGTMPILPPATAPALLTIQDKVDPADREAAINALIADNTSQAGESHYLPLSIVARDDHATLRATLAGYSFYS